MKDEPIIAYLKKELPPEKMANIEKWINTSSENKKHFDRVKFIWDNASSDFSKIEISTMAAWENVQKSTSMGDQFRENHRSISFKPYLRVAASIVILLGLGYLLSRWINNNAFSTQELVTVETTTDRTDVVLPDGSHAWLNHHSTISYPEKFRARNREVNLSGEAFFDVTKNRRKPFLVETESSVVQVLGTTFNVDAEDPASKVIVTVVEGRVSLSDASDDGDDLILEPDEQGIFIPAEHLLFKEKNRDLNFLAWKTGILVFENTSLAQVCSTLSDHFHVSVLMDPMDHSEPQGGLNTRRLTAIYDNRELEEILNIITLTLDISYEFKNDNVTLYATP